jgi:hypothetical protein
MCFGTVGLPDTAWAAIKDAGIQRLTRLKRGGQRKQRAISTIFTPNREAEHNTNSVNPKNLTHIDTSDIPSNISAVITETRRKQRQNGVHLANLVSLNKGQLYASPPADVFQVGLINS